ncbi:MAG: cupin domain-containing protein [Burkholderiales bacterium]
MSIKGSSHNHFMDILLATPLLGGLSPLNFMRRHWQKKPLLIRQAVPGGVNLLSRAKLFELAARDDVESRLIVHDDSAWSLRHGPLKRSAFPSLKRPRWTVLVQGLDLHVNAAHELLQRFRFVPDARLDDLMLSYASDGGGVGPHVDSYDVFLLQVQGRRRWRIGRVKDKTLVPDVPLKILAHFEPEQEWLLEAGDMLYLPPGWAHDGVAEGECLTASIGFRAPGRADIGREILQRLLDDAEPVSADTLYRDPEQAATRAPACIPGELRAFAVDAMRRALADDRELDCTLGEILSEPKPGVWFDAPTESSLVGKVTLDRRTRMLYDARHVFINGESFRAGGRDAKLMRRLADERGLSDADRLRLSPEARSLLQAWAENGWLQPAASFDEGASR